MNKSTAIKVQKLTKTYKLYDRPIDRLKESLHPFKKKYHKDFYALNDVSFEIKKGETVGIIGKNGSGKSTLLKIITGVLTPSSGRVSVHGKISAILELGAGFNPEMTGLENIYLNTSINGMNKAQTDKKIDEIVEFSELGEFIHQPIKTYSSGMKARLAFAVSINVDPDILIVDEALSVGDAAFQRKCFAKMEQIRQSGATILFVSHSEGNILSLCSRAIWISDGNQILDGRPKLVTGLYMKNISKKVIDKIKIEKEYNSFLHSDSSKYIEIESNESLQQQTIVNESYRKSAIKEFYNSSLESKSTIVYEENGASISNVKITTLDGTEVNTLLNGKTYKLSYNVKLDETFPNIQLGMGLKSKNGMVLSGARYPSMTKGIILEKGTYLVEWTFLCRLNKGIYFTMCGVQNYGGKGEFLHRIMDATCFEVKDSSDQGFKQGPIDLDIEMTLNNEG